MNARSAAGVALSLVCAAGCAAPNPSAPSRRLESVPPERLESPSPQATTYQIQSTQARSTIPFEAPPYPGWFIGQPLFQGFFGASLLEQVDITSGGNVEVDGDDGSLDQLPLIGGGAQWKLAGDDVDVGLEGLFSFSGRANAEAFAFGGGGAVVAIDVDLLLIDVYGGPFVSLDLGDHARIYGAGGPVMQFADWDQELDDDTREDGDGFGTGFYARAGIEFEIPTGDFIGFGVRWSDTTVDLSGGLGDLEIEGVQVVFTVSRFE